MIATREGPDVTVEMRQKLYGYRVRSLRNKIALRHFQFIAFESARSGKQVIARAGGQHQEIRRLPFAFHAKPRLLSTRLDRHDMRLLYFAARAQRTVRQKSIQNFARVNDDGTGHFE